MPHSTPRGLVEARIQAGQLLKDLRSANVARSRAAADRFRQLPYWKEHSVEQILGQRDSIRRKQALEVLAIEAGHETWSHYKRALEAGHATRTGISTALQRFFAVEIRNMQGVQPATLGSALDSLLQADTDTIRQWCAPPGLWRYTSVRDLPAVDRAAIEDEIRALVRSRGADTELEVLVSKDILEASPVQKFVVRVYESGAVDDLCKLEVVASSAAAAETQAIADAIEEFGEGEYEAEITTWEQEYGNAVVGDADAAAQVDASIAELLNQQIANAKEMARKAALRALADLAGEDGFNLERANSRHTATVRHEEHLRYVGDFAHEEVVHITGLELDDNGDLVFNGFYVVDPEGQAVDGEAALLSADELTTEDLILLLRGAEEVRAIYPTEQDVMDAFIREVGADEADFVEIVESGDSPTGWEVIYRTDDGKRYFDVRSEGGKLSFHMTDAK